ncbi:hypothetical protein ACGFNU_34120 [Spirillospora sp. NPDC048911]|uniref:hypothetical protein n=1 Tax=Spirillospora sp. NPDC048911 TaxID=3364527 RepID=UPI00371D85DD
MELQQAKPGPESWAPQACTLPTAERPLREAEFDALFGEAVTELQPADPRTVRMRLRPEPQVAARAAELAARETGCCSFFTFTLSITGGALTLEISVSDQHADVLDALTARASQMMKPAGTHP